MGVGLELGWQDINLYFIHFEYFLVILDLISQLGVLILEVGQFVHASFIMNGINTGRY